MHRTIKQTLFLVDELKTYETIAVITDGAIYLAFIIGISSCLVGSKVDDIYVKFRENGYIPIKPY